MKCIDCYWFPKCEGLLQRVGDEEACEWDPDRFMQKRDGNEEEDEMIARVDNIIEIDRGLKHLNEIKNRLLNSLTPKEREVLKSRFRVSKKEIQDMLKKRDNLEEEEPTQ